MKDKRVLEDIVADCKNDPDFLKDMLMHFCQLDRTLMQFYMVYKFKYILGERLKCDPGWETAVRTYESEGYAKKFSDAYTPEKTVRQMEVALYGKL